MSWVRRLIVTALVAAVPAAAAGQVTVKLGTFAPANSTWHKALLEMGAAWERGTERRVRLVVYPGGVQGSESTTIKLMRPGIDQIQAALLMQPGLKQIDDAFNVFGIPFFFESNEELRYLQQKLSPVLKQRLEAKGFHLLNWSNAGWVQLFSKRQLKTLDDLKRVKLFTTEGDNDMVQWYKANGFQPVALPANEIPAQLKLRTGMIEAAPSPPYGALSLQFFRDAPFMLELSIGPLVGATVVTREAWNRIAEPDRAKMLEAAAAMEKNLEAQIVKLDASSIASMQQHGLTVTKVEGAPLSEFQSAAEKLAATMRGSMVPADIYDLAHKERSAFRQSKGASR